MHRFIPTSAPIFLAVLLSGVPAAYGQLAVDQMESFEDPFRGRRPLSLTSFPEGGEVGGILSPWGIRMHGPDSRIVHRVRLFPHEPPINVLPAPPYRSVFSNEPAEESSTSADRPLVLRFGHAVRRVGFSLANGTPGLQASIRAYDPAGVLLGEFLVDHPDSDLGFAWAVATSSEQGMGTLVVDYGGHPLPEQLWLRGFELMEDPVFELFVPQIGAGAIGPGELLQTELVIIGLSDTTAAGSVEFVDDTGAPLPIHLVGRGELTSVAFQLTTSRLRLESDPDDPALRSGYARIVSDAPVSASAALRVLKDGRILSQAGIAAQAAGRRLRGFVSYRPGTPGIVGAVNPLPVADTGLAFANATDREVRVDLRLRGVEGQLSSLGPLILPPRGHLSAFSTELFLLGPQSQQTGFRANVHIEADGPVAVTVLETVNGRVLSSLPIGILAE